MNSVRVALDPGLGIAAQRVVEAWSQEPEAADAGTARVEQAGPGTFLPGVVELVVLPLAVNMVSSVLYDLVKRLVTRAGAGRQVTEVEMVEVTSAAGDRVVVVRSRREVA